ncbi:hypothetical protein [Pseudobacteriovorax antillogorgiicola]|uniref:EF-hand domain-containing protein n=1 Tax=Pseudobacteriovorax antillogorgiicola TaxID=1513793 RepID=A0A1Y6CRR9_9BACT|nr:hypothetical protein [Pseudobacteriovorax antillogorgiicola]TCS40584.1 hypothetical protein EDD56_1563 [Pseudobacteriovorax antillogorgiicola]SMF84608.1 hypothetical protein SAMN06296036_1583 [Pseudobacteriovorax antillogorgiicola]
MKEVLRISWIALLLTVVTSASIIYAHQPISNSVVISMKKNSVSILATLPVELFFDFDKDKNERISFKELQEQKSAIKDFIEKKLVLMNQKNVIKKSSEINLALVTEHKMDKNLIQSKHLQVRMTFRNLEKGTKFGSMLIPDKSKLKVPLVIANGNTGKKLRGKLSAGKQMMKL